MSSLRAGKPMAGRSLNSLNITATHSHRKSLYNHHHSLSSSPMKSGTCDTIINDILFCVGLCYLFGKFQFFSPQLCRYSWTDLNQHLSTDLIFQRLKIQFSCVHAARFPEQQMLCSVSPQQSSLSTLFSIGWHTHVPTQIQIQIRTCKKICNMHTKSLTY